MLSFLQLRETRDLTDLDLCNPEILGQVTFDQDAIKQLSLELREIPVPAHMYLYALAHADPQFLEHVQGYIRDYFQTRKPTDDDLISMLQICDSVELFDQICQNKPEWRIFWSSGIGCQELDHKTRYLWLSRFVKRPFRNFEEHYRQFQEIFEQGITTLINWLMTLEYFKLAWLTVLPCLNLTDPKVKQQLLHHPRIRLKKYYLILYWFRPDFKKFETYYLDEFFANHLVDYYEVDQYALHFDPIWPLTRVKIISYRFAKPMELRKYNNFMEPFRHHIRVNEEMSEEMANPILYKDRTNALIDQVLLIELINQNRITESNDVVQLMSFVSTLPKDIQREIISLTVSGFKTLDPLEREWSDSESDISDWDD